MYCGGALFIDHASGLVHVEFQQHLNTHETLRSKELFEAYCRDHGVVVQGYQTDNGSQFTSKGFSGQLATFQQTIRFAGAGAHHMNGTSERSIGTVMSIARTAMLHAAIHWPEVADSSLWPAAVNHAVFLWNHMPDEKTGLSPIDIFTRTRWPQKKFHDMHVWGCPVYVLDKKISDGGKIPKWKPRSTRQINMGFSTKHASTVPLVLNPNTGSMTNQFHVVFDDWFATIATSPDELPDFSSPEWSRMFGDSVLQYVMDDDVLPEEEPPLSRGREERVERAMEIHRPVRPLPVPEMPPKTRQPRVRFSEPPVQRMDQPPEHPPPIPEPAPTPPQLEEIREERPPIRDPIEPSPQPSRPAPAAPPSPEVPTPRVEPVEQPLTPPMPELRRSSRSNKGVRSQPRHGYDGSQGSGYTAFHETPHGYHAYIEPDPVACKASKSDPDILSYDEAMNSPDRAHWIKAMHAEIDSLVEETTWTEEEARLAKDKILPLTWVFKRKRSPDGEITKYKARICVRGDLQEGVYDTYAPVVSWSSIRLFITMMVVLGWHSCSIDYSSAFVQSTLETPIWVHIPRGFQCSNKSAKMCLRLNKSLYGISISPKLWFQTAVSALIEDGFTQSTLDPCFLFKKDMMLVIYVDDCLIAGKTEKLVTDLIARLRARNFKLTHQSSISDFLGIKFRRLDDGRIEATQAGLIKKIIEATGLQDSNPNLMPAAQVALGSDPEGEPMKESWNMRSICGMLLYLATNTRLDIALAVSAVCRFTHNPKQSHATAVKTIVRYLKGTADKGCIYKPTSDLSLVTYVDADFMGLYGREPDESQEAVKSRTGWIITLAGVPLIWKTVLQGSVALSTQMAEYQALSHAMTFLIPVRTTLIEVGTAVGLSPSRIATVTCTVFEDNNACLILATKQQLTNRSRYFLVKWHFFWSYVKTESNPDGFVRILPCDTHAMNADPLTKQNPLPVFVRFRKRNMGW